MSKTRRLPNALSAGSHLRLPGLPGLRPGSAFTSVGLLASAGRPSTEERSALCRWPVVAARRVEVRDDGGLRYHPQRVVRGGWRVRDRGACDAGAAIGRGHRARTCQHGAPLSCPKNLVRLLYLSSRMSYLLHIYLLRYPCREVVTAGQALSNAYTYTKQDSNGACLMHRSTNICVIMIQAGTPSRWLAAEEEAARTRATSRL